MVCPQTLLNVPWNAAERLFILDLLAVDERWSLQERLGLATFFNKFSVELYVLLTADVMVFPIRCPKLVGALGSIKTVSPQMSSTICDTN